MNDPGSTPPASGGALIPPVFPEPVWGREEIEAFLARHFEFASRFGAQITHIEAGALEVRLPFREAFLRPGGTISGPTQMTLVDTAFFYLILAHLGDKALAVTTSLSMNFLRRPAAGAVVARARLLKLGRRLAVGDVTITSEGDPRPVSHAQVTYAIPPAGVGIA